MRTGKEADKILDGYERFVSDRYKRTEFTNLEIGEVYYFPFMDVREYNRVYGQMRRNGKRYHRLDIKNGVLIKRVR